MNQKLKGAFVIVVLLLLSAFSIFIWPTPFKYSTVKIGNWEFTKRTGRFSGKSHIRTIKALVPALEKWQYEHYGASVGVPGVEGFAKELMAGKFPTIFNPENYSKADSLGKRPTTFGLLIEANNTAMAFLYETRQEWIWLDWY